MGDLDSQQKSDLKKLLERKAEELIESQAQLKESAKPVSLDKPIGRLSRMDEIQQQQIANNAKARSSQQLQAVKAALQRIGTEDFGICMECAEPIPFERLKKRPESVYCIDCQEARE